MAAKKKAKLEKLAKELESIKKRGDELKDVIAHVRDDDYDRAELALELQNLKLGYYANKLAKGFYDVV